MERYYTCNSCHSFKVTGEGDEPSTETTAEVYFKVDCPYCHEPYEIHWPSDRGFVVSPK
jgi:hypothetical protein